MLFVDIFLLRDRPYRFASSDRASSWLMPLILLSTGSLYGLLVALFQRGVGGVIHGVEVNQISDMILFGGNMIAGIFIVLFFHGGVTMLVWLMAKGVGGPGGLALLYRTTSLLLPAALPALPFLAADNALAEGIIMSNLPLGVVYAPLAAWSAIAMVAGLYHTFRVTQQVASKRCAFAVFLVLFFSFGVLMLF